VLEIKTFKPEPTASQNGAGLGAGATFAQASFSLAALETLEYPARQPLGEQRAAQIFVRTHWKNFHLNFCALQAIEQPPFKKSLELLHRADRLMRTQVPFELDYRFDPVATKDRAKQKNLKIPLPQQSKVPNFYFAMLRKEVLKG
jgi:hypothetical protein